MSTNVRTIRQPPHSIEAEQSLLGGLMLEPKTWARVCHRVTPEDFYRADHRMIWLAIRDAHDDDGNADAVVICERLQRAGKLEAGGGREYIAQMARDTPSAALAEKYAEIVHGKALERELLRLADNVSRIVTEPSELSTAEKYAEAARLFAGLQGGARVGRGLVDAGKLVAGFRDYVERRKAGEKGLSVGIPDLDRLTNGLERGDLVCFGARPGMGKTSLLVSISMNVSKTEGVAIFSAEMPSMQIMRRNVALVGGIDQGKLRRVHELDGVDWQNLSDATDLIANRQLWIDDTSSPSIDYIRGEVLALAARSKLGLVMVDYVQLVRGKGDSRHQQLSDVAYALKDLAKDAQVPVVMLAQLNRSVESRPDKRPLVSDIRESGGIEEAADIIGLLYCESYYDKEFGLPNVIECALEKNRNGEKGHCLWQFNGSLSRIGTIDDGAREQYWSLLRAKHRGRSGKDDDL